jgi:hypothetical protein
MNSSRFPAILGLAAAAFCPRARRNYRIPVSLNSTHKVLEEHASCRNFWASRALSEVTPHPRGGEVTAAIPTAGHVRTSRPSAQIGLWGQLPRQWMNFWPPRAFREMPPHLAGRELRAAVPPARHPRPRRSSNEIDGLGVQLPNPSPAPNSCTGGTSLTRIDCRTGGQGLWPNGGLRRNTCRPGVWLTSSQLSF